jgi:hypothetical protein
MSITTAEFSQAVQKAAANLFPHHLLQLTIIRATRMKARIHLGPDQFVDIFFREETQRVDFALIVAGQRVFGLDNLSGWHEHPVHDPSQHIPCPEPTPEEALRRLREAADSLSSFAKEDDE